MTDTQNLPPNSIRISTISTGRRVRNALMVGAISASILFAVVGLGAAMFDVVKQGFHDISFGFLTRPIPVFGLLKGGGMGPAVAGTIIIVFWAALIAIPLGIMGAVYVVEFGAAKRLASVIRFLSDVMAGVPSIVMGLFIFVTFTLKFKQEGFGGSLALACLMLPIVIRSTETMLRLVPRDQREASRALGASSARTTLTVVLPAALPGITSGCLLAIARAAGETAPLIFTIGIIHAKANWNVFSGPNTTLSAQIFAGANSVYSASIGRAWAAAFTLIALVVILMIVARLVTFRYARKLA